jgi:hypothetical protein
MCTHLLQNKVDVNMTWLIVQFHKFANRVAHRADLSHQSRNQVATKTTEEEPQKVKVKKLMPKEIVPAELPSMASVLQSARYLALTKQSLTSHIVEGGDPCRGDVFNAKDVDCQGFIVGIQTAEEIKEEVPVRAIARVYVLISGGAIVPDGCPAAGGEGEQGYQQYPVSDTLAHTRTHACPHTRV